MGSSIPSSVFALEVLEISPSVTTPPGKRLLLSVKAEGTDLSYRWHIGTDEFAGAGAQFTTPWITSADHQKEFWVEVTDGLGNKAVSGHRRIYVVEPTSKVIALTGTLKKKNGQSDFATDLRVSLYAAKEGGAALYVEEFLAENAQGVNVEAGKFVVRLGEGQSNGPLVPVVKNNASLYVEFTVLSDALEETLSPRLALTAAPYAMAESGQVSLKGEDDPCAVVDATTNETRCLDASIGTYYVNTTSSKTWQKVYSGWIQID